MAVDDIEAGGKVIDCYSVSASEDADALSVEDVERRRYVDLGNIYASLDSSAEIDIGEKDVRSVFLSEANRHVVQAADTGDVYNNIVPLSGLQRERIVHGNEFGIRSTFERDSALDVA